MYIHSDGPIKVQMKCSQVTRHVYCRFYFQNTADEDYYILEDKSPLEGLDYPYLTISQGDKVIEYQGIHASRMAPTKDRYVLIEAGKTITSPVADLISSYKFDSDGTYTIEYTKPFVYISDAEMSMIDDDENLPQEAGYDDLVASTEIELRDTKYLKPTDYEVQMAYKKFKEKTALDDDTVYTSTNCRQVKFDRKKQLPDKSRSQIVDDVTELHDDLCKNAFPAAVDDATDKSDEAPYKTYFGSQDNKVPLKVLGDVNKNLQYDFTHIEYVFRGEKCKFYFYAYSQYPVRKVFFCKKFETAPKYATAKNYDSKFETMAHEYTHAFANTDDVGYGHKYCTKKITAAKALNNADSYGYYVQDVSNKKL